MYYFKVGINKKGGRIEIIYYINNVDYNEYEERKELEWKKNGESEVFVEESKCISFGDDFSYIEYVIIGLCLSLNI